MPTLTIALKDEALRALSGHSIAIAKSAAVGPGSVVWVAVRPSPLVKITWTEIYGLFAARVPDRSGPALHIVAALYPARDQSTYAFRDGAFGEPTTERRILKNNYDIRNDTPTAPIAFGLLQGVTVNGSHVLSPLNVAVIPANDAAAFTPSCHLALWSEGSATSGAVRSQPLAGALRIPYAANRAVARYCSFDVCTHSFVLDSGVGDDDDLL